MSDPFVSAAELAQFIGMDQPADLARMQVHVEGASAIIRRFCDQVLSVVADEVVILAGIERDTLLLPERPVTAISALTVNAVVYTNYRFTRAGRIIELSGMFWTLGATVTYTHGYAEATDEYKAIKTVCLESAARAFTMNANGASAALGSTVMEATGYAPEVFLSRGETMLLADMGKVLVG